MPDSSAQTVALQIWLDRLKTGEPDALEALLQHVRGRLERLTRLMLRGHPAVQRWAQTDDVLQGALVRLLRAMETVHPDSVRAFIGLASQQIRRELIDLARHYYGPEGIGANHASHPDPDAGPPDAPDPTASPDSLAEWREFHERIEDLPEDEREVVSLVFYQGLTQAEAAELLQVAVRTVQRRWHAALVKLNKVFQSGIVG